MKRKKRKAGKTKTSVPPKKKKVIEEPDTSLSGAFAAAGISKGTFSEQSGDLPTPVSGTTSTAVKRKEPTTPRPNTDTNHAPFVVAPTKRAIRKKKPTHSKPKISPSETVMDLTHARLNPRLFGAREQFTYRGVRNERSNTVQPRGEGEIDLVIGLDFGTSFTKVVVQEPAGKSAWAIPFTSNESNKYLLPTRVYEKAASFSLTPEAIQYGNLKSPLLFGTVPQWHAITVTAFLALVIQHTMNWIAQNVAEELLGLEPLWSVNIGLPAKNLENTGLVRGIHRMGCAALVISLLGKIDDEGLVPHSVCEKNFARVIRQDESGQDSIPLSETLSVHKTQVAVFPEIAAQINGFVQSDRWDKKAPKFMLVDIGGGTIDAAIFNVVHKTGGGNRFSFFQSVVEPLGANILHEKRINWLLDEAVEIGTNTSLVEELRKACDITVCGQVFDSMHDYILDAGEINQTIDDEFYSNYSRMLLHELINYVRRKVDTEREQWKNLPFLFCGGGRDIDLYRRFVNGINNNRSFAVNLNEFELEAPEKLTSPDLPVGGFQRLSVAYGLSFQDLGECITPDNIDDLDPPDRPQSGGPGFVSKDMV